MGDILIIAIVGAVCFIAGRVTAKRPKEYELYKDRKTGLMIPQRRR